MPAWRTSWSICNVCNTGGPCICTDPWRRSNSLGWTHEWHCWTLFTGVIYCISLYAVILSFSFIQNLAVADFYLGIACLLLVMSVIKNMLKKTLLGGHHIVLDMTHRKVFTLDLRGSPAIFCIVLDFNTSVFCSPKNFKGVFNRFFSS